MRFYPHFADKDIVAQRDEETELAGGGTWAVGWSSDLVF